MDTTHPKPPKCALRIGPAWVISRLIEHGPSGKPIPIAFNNHVQSSIANLIFISSSKLNITRQVSGGALPPPPLITMPTSRTLRVHQLHGVFLFVICGFAFPFPYGLPFLRMRLWFCTCTVHGHTSNLGSVSGLWCVLWLFCWSLWFVVCTAPDCKPQI